MNLTYEIFHHPFILLMMTFLLILSLYFIIVVVKDKKFGRYEFKDTSWINNGLTKQILSMLNQSGGALSQTQIGDNLSINPEKVSNILKGLEKERKIVRKWDLNELTYNCEYQA